MVVSFVGKQSPIVQGHLARLRLILLAIVNAVLVFYSIIWIQRTGGFLMPTLGVPQLVAQLSVPIGCGLSVLYSIARLFR